MCLITNARTINNDEDLPAMKKTKSRNPKPRDKWSLLWFIPSQVLNYREEITDGKGRSIKKGKRFGFERFNQLSCKVCRKAFHKYQALTFHTSDEHSGQASNSISSRTLRVFLVTNPSPKEIQLFLPKTDRVEQYLILKVLIL